MAIVEGRRTSIIMTMEEAGEGQPYINGHGRRGKQVYINGHGGRGGATPY